MSDKGREPYPIRWSAPSNAAAHPVWSGPRAHEGVAVSAPAGTAGAAAAQPAPQPGEDGFRVDASASEPSGSTPAGAMNRHDVSAPEVVASPAEPAAARPAPGDAPRQVIAQHDDLPEDSLTIGRSRSNSIVLDDMLVSRRHLVITADDEGLLLRDLGSRNGTFVNGRKVSQTHLHEGDRLGVGASTFEVRDGWLVSV